MRRSKLVLLFVLIMTLLFAGCGITDKIVPAAKDTFPEGYTIQGIDVSGMNAEQAKEAIMSTLDAYQIEVTLDGIAFNLTANDLGLEVDNTIGFNGLIEAANEKDAQPTDISVIKMADSDLLEQVLLAAYLQCSSADGEGDAEAGEEETVTVNPQKASIQYSSEEGRFIGVDGVSGEAVTYTQAAKDLAEAVSKLEKSVTTSSAMEMCDGEKASESEEVKAALENANGMLGLDIKCSFQPAGKDAVTETIPTKTIASWLSVALDGISVAIDGESMATYCTDLAAKHNTAGKRKANFKTTAGGTISVKVASAGQTVDANALYLDIFSAIEKKESKTINAVYSDVTEADGDYTNFGGNYCEVDLTDQKVYVYKDGALVVESQCVTGCVAKGHATPSGVYKIFAMNKDRYLRGDGYESWVNFFVPFNGGIGFHDASWRRRFGGNIYLYSGSHGCINMPYANAKKLYENVSMGETVVVHGGVTAVEGIAQVWSGTTEYSLEPGAAAFTLDIKCKDDAKMTYASDNSSVASVDENGKVTIKGIGTATITVSSEATSMYKASTKKVTIKVAEALKDATLTVGSDSYNKLTTDGAFSLNASVNSGAKLTYSSNNDSVAVVDKNGKVTIKGAGTAKITIAWEATDKYTAGKKTVTVKVTAPKPEPQPEPETQTPEPQPEPETQTPEPDPQPEVEPGA